VAARVELRVHGSDFLVLLPFESKASGLELEPAVQVFLIVSVAFRFAPGLPPRAAAVSEQFVAGALENSETGLDCRWKAAEPHSLAMAHASHLKE